MSFLFGAGRPQPSSAEKIAAAETEVELVSDMFNRFVAIYSPLRPFLALGSFLAAHKSAPSASSYWTLVR